MDCHFRCSFVTVELFVCDRYDVASLIASLSSLPVNMYEILRSDWIQVNPFGQIG